MTALPFHWNLDPAPFYDHNIFPNTLYRRAHPQHHDPLTFDTLGLMARMWPHSKSLIAKRNGDLHPLRDLLLDDFEIHLDVGLFQPEEITVKLVDDQLIIEAKHEERPDDHGHISRHFIRRYTVPKGFDMDEIASTFSADGVLNVKIPKIQTEKKPERVIKIQQVGPSDLFLKSGPDTSKNVNKNSISTLTDNNIKSDKGNNTEANAEAK